MTILIFKHFLKVLYSPTALDRKNSITMDLSNFYEKAPKQALDECSCDLGFCTHTYLDYWIKRAKYNLPPHIELFIFPVKLVETFSN